MNRWVRCLAGSHLQPLLLQHAVYIHTNCAVYQYMNARIIRRLQIVQIQIALLTRLPGMEQLVKTYARGLSHDQQSGYLMTGTTRLTFSN